MFKLQKTKTLEVKANNNSSDYISPNIIYGCRGGCSRTYCYTQRYNKNNVYLNYNWGEILKACKEEVSTREWPKVSNQQDPFYYIFDIGCHTDLALYQKKLNLLYNRYNSSKGLFAERNNKSGLWNLLYMFNQGKMKSTFATKYSHLITEKVKDIPTRPRIRVSLMPELYSEILEPKTTMIETRIKDINRLKNLGWEVHLNFSPIIIYNNNYTLYKELFEQVSKVDLRGVKSELIFLTNHKVNMSMANKTAKSLMVQANEVKNVQGVMRYPIKQKHNHLKMITYLHNKYLKIPIRYAF